MMRTAVVSSDDSRHSLSGDTLSYEEELLTALIVGFLQSSSNDGDRTPHSSPSHQSQGVGPQRVAIVGPPSAGKSFLVKKVLSQLSASSSRSTRSIGSSVSGLAPFDVVDCRMIDALSHEFEDGRCGVEAFFRWKPASSNTNTTGGRNGRKRILLFDHVELFFPPALPDEDEEESAASSSGPFYPKPLDAVRTGQFLECLTQLDPDAFVILLATSYHHLHSKGNDGWSGAFDPFLEQHGVDITIQMTNPSTKDRLALVRPRVWAALTATDHGGTNPFIASREEEGGGKGKVTFAHPAGLEQSVRVLAERAAAKTGGLPVGLVSKVCQELATEFESAERQQEVFRWLMKEKEEGESSDGSGRLSLPLPLFRVIDSCVGDCLASIPQQEVLSVVDFPATPWSSIAGLESVKTQLLESFSLPQKHTTTYQQLGITPCIGVLLYGIPGTGKTMLAKAIATELNATFLSLSIPQLVHAEVGESERVVDELFDTALERSPSIVFLDELQAVFTRRDGVGGFASSGSSHDARLTSLILSRLDGCRLLYHSSPVLFVGATNVPSLLDPALLAPGRMDVHIQVPPPEAAARRTIIRKALSFHPFESDDLRLSVEESLVARTEGCSGADVANKMNQFGLRALALAPTGVGRSSDSDSHVEEPPLAQETAQRCVDLVSPSYVMEFGARQSRRTLQQ